GGVVKTPAGRAGILQLIYLGCRHRLLRSPGGHRHHQNPDFDLLTSPTSDPPITAWLPSVAAAARRGWVGTRGGGR
uniref:Uncharacterized protein n=1 Tax=Aegilops tauschii subsp. strangulata TaxID=200361 RepID=A0A453EBA9_AEGTS